MTRYISFIVLIFAAFIAKAYTVEQIPNVHIENRTRFVSNPDGILSASAQAQADSIISNIWQTSSAEVVAVIVNEIAGSDIDSFATNLFTHWGIGKKDNDNGLLILIVKDLRKAVIRTGYGIEGVVPDVVAGRIIRENMAPHFRNGDYNSGTLEALTRLAQIITNPDASGELMSQYKNDSNATTDTTEIFTSYLALCVLLSVGMLIWFLSVLYSSRKKDRYDQHQTLDKIKSPALFASFLGLGMPLIAYIPLILIMRHLRTKPRECPNCHHTMHRLSEDEDNKFLTPAQDTEERLNSVDYDVWLCDSCGEVDILPFIQKSSSYTICPICRARTCSMIGNRIVVQASNNHEGRGVKEYRCSNCHHTSQTTYTIPKTETPIIFIGGGGGRGFGGGGGFSGGSFGGGFTGGGGASGGW